MHGVDFKWSPSGPLGTGRAIRVALDEIQLAEVSLVCWFGTV